MKTAGESKILYLTLGGLAIAGVTFLVVFITSPRAASQKRIPNLRIPPMSAPPRPKIPPLSGQATVTTASPISLPVEESETQTGTQAAEFSETESLLPSPQATQSGEEALQ